jgi:hypothetical protein
MTMVLPLLTNIPESETSHVQPILAMDPSSAFHQVKAVMDCPLKRWKGVMFDDKAKVAVLIQRACTFKKQKLADEANEELQEEQQALARAVSTRQYAVVSQEAQGP